MKRFASIVAGALVFGLVAGASMVGVNVAARNIGIISEETASANSGNATIAETQPAETQATTAPAPTVTGSTVSTGKTVTDIVKESMPSVVSITNMMRYQQNGFSIFGSYQTSETEVPASGSGIIVGKTDTELLIVTNNHVVSDSNSLTVTFVDSKAVDAVIKGTDANADLAVIAVKLSDIPTDTLNAIKVATLGNSDELQVGDQVVAIGNALGYGQSVTTGIISAKNRDVSTSKGTESGLLQTDAAINPGNSGGALINMKGEVIGINVAKYTSTSIEGMGYSIPSAKAKTVIDNLSSLETREAVPENERGYLGVYVKNITQETANSFGMPQGVFIYKFIDDTTANNSGLQEKDIITAVNGQGVETLSDIEEILSGYRAGEHITVTVQRPNGSQYDQIDVDVVLGQNPENTDANINTNGPQAGNGQNGGAQNGGQNGNPNDGSGQNGGAQGGNGNDGNGANGGAQGGNGNDGNGANGGGQGGNNGGAQNGNTSADELWKEFQQFFQQYQR